MNLQTKELPNIIDTFHDMHNHPTRGWVNMNAKDAYVSNFLIFVYMYIIKKYYVLIVLFLNCRMPCSKKSRHNPNPNLNLNLQQEVPLSMRHKSSQRYLVNVVATTEVLDGS